MIARKQDQRNLEELGAYSAEKGGPGDTRIQSQRHSWQEIDEMAEYCLLSMEAH